jgi:hypothetical protein
MSETEELRYACVDCKVHWGNLDQPEDEASHGLCPACLRKHKDVFQRRQIREGTWACYATAVDYCDQSECLFRESCLLSEVEEWEKKVHGRKTDQ